MRTILVILVFYCSFATANFQSDLMSAKNAKKQGTQWTLVDWLAQKNDMALADQWLAANRNSQDLFELDMGGGYGEYKLKTTSVSGSTKANRFSEAYSLNLYIWILNLYGEYERMSDNREAYGGAAGLRIFGVHSQTTNLVVRYGIRTLHDLARHESWNNEYVEGVLQLYVLSQFGLQGSYRHYFPDTSDLGAKLKGTRNKAGAFFEFGPFRFYGDYYVEPMEIDSSGTLVKEERTGFEYGLKLYF